MIALDKPHIRHLDGFCRCKCSTYVAYATTPKSAYERWRQIRDRFHSFAGNPDLVLDVVYVALHLAQPPDGAPQHTYELEYPGYRRVALHRPPGGWNDECVLDFGANLTGPGCVARHISIAYGPQDDARIMLTGRLSKEMKVFGPKPNRVDLFCVGHLYQSSKALM